MAGDGSGRLGSVLVMVILAVATVTVVMVTAEEAQTTCCATTTQDVVNYCDNVLSSEHFRATITCCIMAQNQPSQCWCDIRHALGDDALGPNCLQGASC